MVVDVYYRVENATTANTTGGGDLTSHRAPSKKRQGSAGEEQQRQQEFSPPTIEAGTLSTLESGCLRAAYVTTCDRDTTTHGENEPSSDPATLGSEALSGGRGGGPKQLNGEGLVSGSLMSTTPSCWGPPFPPLPMGESSPEGPYSPFKTFASPKERPTRAVNVHDFIEQSSWGSPEASCKGKMMGGLHLGYRLCD